MSKIKKASELIIPETVAGLIYGQPGIGKSTIALSSPNPILIDAENGVHRVQTEYRVDTLQVQDYQEILDELPNLKEYQTIVFDTINEVLVHIEKYIIKKNAKAVSADGKMNMYGYGLRSVEFKNLVNTIKYMGKNLIFVAHEVETKDDNGNTIIRPEISGKASAEIMKFLDFVGYCEMAGKRRTVSFAPCSKYYAKNSIKLNDIINIPTLEYGDKNNFVTEYIINPTIQTRQGESEERKEIDLLLTKGRDIIANSKDPNATIAEFKKMDLPLYVSLKLFEELKASTKLSYNEETRVFE